MSSLETPQILTTRSAYIFFDLSVFPVSSQTNASFSLQHVGIVCGLQVDSVPGERRRTKVRGHVPSFSSSSRQYRWRVC